MLYNPDANLTIGNNSSIGHQDIYFCSQKIVMRNDCLIAPFAVVGFKPHEFRRRKNK